MAQRAHAELIKNWAEDDSIEIEVSYNGGETWHDIGNPSWHSHYLYRIKETKPSIDWSHIATEYRWLAMDKCGEAYVYDRKPSLVEVWNAWDVSGQYHNVGVLVSYKAGTCDWKNSLVERPEGV